ncbi:hypothetical protein Q0812_01840 [Brevundimonas sp. 2R-24]|uniref:DUF4870 domain-containing protein n=1 Tax=Peiella sedimenti TaxID=3061083 RepID=A0ABT8SI77_9CAUL|nr:hypothetical protein [Caulobacteraceae bacterium XZ-24]
MRPDLDPDPAVDDQLEPDAALAEAVGDDQGPDPDPDPEPVPEPEQIPQPADPLPEPEPAPDLEPEPIADPAPVEVPTPMIEEGGDPFDDHLIGFCTPDSLAGRAISAPLREAEPAPGPEPEPTPEAVPVPAMIERLEERDMAAIRLEDHERIWPALTVYACIIGAPMTVGASALIGLYLAHVNRGDAPDWLASHMLFQVRTIWIAVAVAVIGGVTILIGLGVFVLAALVVWMLLRGVTGIWRLLRGQSIVNPNTLLV